MSIFKIHSCPHCGAAIEAFHGTRWESLETQVGAERDHCPSCKEPYDPERLEWQEWSGSGRWKSQCRAAFEWGAAAVWIALFVVIANGLLLPRGLFGIPREFYGLALFGWVLLAGLYVTRGRGGFRRLGSKDFLKIETEAKRRVEPEVPPWETGPPAEGVCGMPSRPPGHRVPDSLEAPTLLKELAHRIALAFLQPGADPQVMERLRVLSETACQWPPMRPAEADRKLGILTMTGDDGTRAYVTIREDGRGHLSLLKRDGLERVVRFEYSLKRRRRLSTGSRAPHIRKSSPR